MAESEHESDPEPAALETTRLVLRQWYDSDCLPFAALNADPRVAEFLPHPLARAESDQLSQRIRKHFSEHGFGLWAVEVRNDAPFIGFVGLSIPGFEAPFTPCVEIGWRLAYSHWNKGYATEAARRVLHFAFDALQLAQLVSFTVPSNQRSRHVMEKLGFSHQRRDDFDHPAIPPNHPLRRHVLYRLNRSDWLGQGSAAG